MGRELVAALERIRRAWGALRGFEGAQHSPQHFRRPIGAQQSPDAAIEAAGTSLAEWGRYLDENHDIAIGIVDDLVTNVVGNGIHIRPRPAPGGGAVSETMADAIERAWLEWTRTPEVTGELPWSELQRLSCRAWLRDGEFFAQHVENVESYPFATGDVRYRIEFLESAMVPLDSTNRDSNARHGVFHDDWNRPIAYEVFLRHPNDYTAGSITSGTAGDLFRVKRVPVERMMHVKFARRWPQTRGVPILHGVIRRLQDIKDYEDSERIAARVAASMCAYIRRDPANTYETKDKTWDNVPERMQAGRIFTDLLPGEEIGTVATDRPNAGLSDFVQQQLRAVAAGTGTRYSSISRDYSGTYSSQRQELVEARPHYERLRTYYVERFVRPVYEHWLRQAVMQGAIPEVPATASLEDIRAAEYIGPGMPWIDPLKEVQADKLAIETGLITREQVIINRGGDPRTVPEPEPEPAPVMESTDDDEAEGESDSGAEERAARHWRGAGDAQRTGGAQ